MATTMAAATAAAAAAAAAAAVLVVVVVMGEQGRGLLGCPWWSVALAAWRQRCALPCAKTTSWLAPAAASASLE